MIITELIKELQLVREKHGDIKVVWQSLTHSFPPELRVTRAVGVTDIPEEVLILNS